jgi:SAM-dependent methyltransferase
VLDLGAGEAYVAAALSARTGPGCAVWTWGCTVRCARRYAIYDGLRLPFADVTFDTTLLLLTLHHCERPDAVLDEAIRVTRHRLVVTESIYRTRGERFWPDLLDARANRCSGS